MSITVKCNLQVKDILDVTFDELTYIIHTEKKTTRYATLINSQTNNQLSPKKYHRW